MSNPTSSSGNVAYDPLPLTTAGEQADHLYNAPPMPSAGQIGGSQTPLMDDIGTVPLSVPSAIPRFQGQALYDDPGAPVIRDSYASSQNSAPLGSEDAGSVYGFNDQGRMSQYRDDPYYVPENSNSLSMPLGQRSMQEKRATYAPPNAKSKRKIIILALIAAAILLILAVVIPLYFTVIKPKSASTSSKSSDTSSKPSDSAKTTSAGGGTVVAGAVVTGGDGTKVTLSDGTTMTYSNPYGGTWYWDEMDPLNNGARAQTWSPALNETFKYGVDRIRGVNLGGWLVTEPFIAPALYQAYSSLNPAPVDEWTLCQAMRADTANGGISQLENHYKTFITEQDFIQIAAAGLNYVRIPIGYWAIEVRDDEPFLEKTSWTYFLKAVEWARKYGIRINLDLHGIPGSQNGWNHSGKFGTINFLYGPMGYANAQRALDYIRILAEFISQPAYSSVVTMFGIMNEPQGNTILEPAMKAFYGEVYSMVRGITGIGEGKGPFISFHDAFLPRSTWAGYLANGDRMSLDSHPYLCFDAQSTADMSTYATTPCSSWGGDVKGTMKNFGLANAGEYSNAVTDCGLFLNGVGLGTRYEGTYNLDGKNWPNQGSCDPWTQWQNWDSTMIKSMLAFNLASMDALQNSFFWTWKIGNSTKGVVEAPAWSYQLGLENGWIPQDPRTADGTCKNNSPFSGDLQPWQTGGSGAGNVDPAATSGWPPASLENAGAVSTLPSYTATGVIPTLPAPTFASITGTATATPTYSLGSGWFDKDDSAGLAVSIAGCQYLDPWIGTAAPPPVCTPASTRRRNFAEPKVAEPLITPAPPAPRHAT